MNDNATIGSGGMLPTLGKAATLAELQAAYRDLEASDAPEFLKDQDGRLAIGFTEASQAGRDARALLADGIVDVWLWGTRPVVRLRVSSVAPY